MDTTALLKSRGLKTTQPRVIVLQALQENARPMTPQEISSELKRRGRPLNIVTIYRVLESLEEVHLVHRYQCRGGYGACLLPGKLGHHVLAHCATCGSIHEFIDEKLCKLESGIARKAELLFTRHFSEICGICRNCRSTD